jgi:enoyl-CoA hydratase/carnithine racemase
MSGDRISAQEAEVAGLVAKVYPAEKLVESAIAMGEQISKFSKPVVAMAKDAVNAAYETTLDQGIVYERRLFHSTFGTVSVE